MISQPAYLPTKEEIEEACLEIQKTWDEHTRLKRRYGITQEEEDSVGWTPPVVNLNEIRKAASYAKYDQDGLI